MIVSISDSGKGIQAGDFEKIFKPFYTTKTIGIGMGLSITKRIIEVHGGKLLAENNPDMGATFLFTLPVAKGDIS